MILRPAFNPLFPTSELVYTLLVVFFCFLIFYKTKEAYNLTGYKGIKYFRNIFVFLGLAYVSRLILFVVTFSGFAFDFYIPRHILFPLSMVPVGYFSTLAMFSLVHSVIWKQVKETQFIMFSYAVAILITVLAVLFRSITTLIMAQLILISAAILLSVMLHKKSKRFKNILTIYVFLLFFWIINIFLLTPRRFIPFEVKMTLQLLSLGVFIVIFFKIIKWIR